jgi:hypothetical protein
MRRTYQLQALSFPYRRAVTVSILGLIFGSAALVIFGMTAARVAQRPILGPALTATANAQLVPVVPTTVPLGIPTLIPSGQHRPAIVHAPGGRGALYRTGPRMDAVAGNGPSDGDTVYLIEQVTNELGEIWWEVQQQDGRMNYIPIAWLQMQ